MNQALPFGLQSDTVLLALVATLTFVSVLALWYGLIERDRSTARVRMVIARREELRAGLDRQTKRRDKRSSDAFMARVVKSLKLAQTEQAEKIRMKLMRAGKRSREAVTVYFFCKAVMPVLFGIGFAFMLYIVDFMSLQPGLKPFLIGAGLLAGFYAPEIFLTNLAKKRMQAVQKGLPDGLDLLVICAEAGLSLEHALHRVSDEMGNSSAEMSEELALTAIELNFLPERKQALLNLANRVDLPAMRGVVNTLVQTEKYGTPLSQSLRVLSAEFREHRMLKAEEKAARLPAMLTVPMIVFILPTLFIVLGGPAMIDIYDTLINR